MKQLAILCSIVLILTSFPVNSEDVQTDKNEAELEISELEEETESDPQDLSAESEIADEIPQLEIPVLLNLAEVYTEKEPQKSIEYGRRALELAKKTGNKFAEAESLANIATTYRYQNDYDTALVLYTTALEIYQNLGDKSNIALSLLDICILRWRKGDYGEALNSCFKSNRLYEEIDDKKGIAESLHNVGIVHDLLGNYEKAIENHEKALHIREEMNDKNGIADSLNNIGIVNYFSQKYDKAIEYYLKALSIRHAIDDKENSAKILNNLGVVYTELKQYDKALEYYLNALEIHKKIDNKYEIANISNNIGKLYVEQGIYAKAIEFLTNARVLGQQMKSKELIRENHEFFSSLYTAMGNYKQALEYYKKSIDVKWEMFEDVTTNTIANMQVKYESEKKEEALKLLKKDYAIQELELDRQKLFRNSFIGGFILVIILVVIIYNRYRIKRIANERLGIEKAKSDRLLLNVLPAKVAHDLKETGKTEPESFENVTVYFSDVVGFTPLSAGLEPKVLIGELNDIFTQFDTIVEKNHCERIKTIGDAYLCVCGMPEENPLHAENIVQSAIEIIQYLRERNQRSEIQWCVRIGIHTGKVVGGVVGVKKYIYDVFGDTINTAARMESNSESMKINVSEVTFAIVKDQFPFVPRGSLSVKGKGDMNMYFIDI